MCAPLTELLRPFARSISAKAKALKELTLTSTQQARLLESISDDIKKCSNFVAPEVSKAALEKADSIGIDLYCQNWHDQGRFDPGRVVFQWEHVVPVSAVREVCRKNPVEAAVTEALKRIRVAWILKSEDVKLTRLGYRSNRPDPDAAYIHAGIELVMECKSQDDVGSG
jgi:hypothetical protein